MKTITLRYDEHDPSAVEAIDTMLSKGLFRTRRWSLGAWRTRRAIRDIERGKVIRCGSFEEYVKMTSDVRN